MRRRSLAGTLIAAALAFGFLVLPQPAQTAPGNDPRAEREKVQAEQAKLAAELNTSISSTPGNAPGGIAESRCACALALGHAFPAHTA